MFEKISFSTASLIPDVILTLLFLPVGGILFSFVSWFSRKASTCVCVCVCIHSLVRERPVEFFIFSALFVFCLLKRYVENISPSLVIKLFIIREVNFNSEVVSLSVLILFIYMY